MEKKTKKCSKCGEEKPLEEFYRHKSKKYGVRSECKLCSDKMSCKYSKTHRKQINERRRKNYPINKDKIIKKSAEYYESNHDKCIAARQRYYATHRRQICDSRNRKRKENREYYLTKWNEYKSINKEKFKLYYQKQKKRIDDLMDSYIVARLVRQGFSSTDITPDLIELKRQQLKLERAYRLLNKEINNQNK